MVAGLLKKLFGDKSTKDRKEYQPIIDKSNEFFNSFKSLSDDDLRNKTISFQGKIKAATSDLEKELSDLNKKAADVNTEIHEKEELFDQIDKLVKMIDEKIEEVLEEIMAEAFAVIKETARRWAENGHLTVTAKEFDRELSMKKDGITIDEDKAIWHNKWTAAGADVQ